MTRHAVVLGVLVLVAGSGSAADPSLPPGALLRVGSPWFYHGVAIQALAFSPEGGTLFTADANRMLRAWDVKSGREIRRPEHVGSLVNVIAVSPDGKLIAVGCDDAHVRIFASALGGVEATLRGHEESVRAVAFSPDGRTLASAGGGTVRLWDASAGKEQTVLVKQPATMAAVAFSPDGRRVACGGRGETITLVDVPSGREVGTFAGHKGGVRCVAWSPDGKRLASGGEDESLRLWDPATGKEVKSLGGFDGAVKSLAFHPGGKRVAAVCLFEPARLVECDTGRVEKLVLPHDSDAMSAAFSPDGKLLALGGCWRRVHLRTTADMKELPRPEGAGREIVTVGFTADGRELLTVDVDGTTSLWDRDGKCLATLPAPGGKAASGVSAVAVERHVLASQSPAGGLRLTDPVRRKTLADIDIPPPGRDSGIALSPDARRVAALAEGKLQVFDVESRKLLTTFEGTHKGASCPLTSVAFHPDGKSLVAGGSEGDLFFWDIETRQLLRRDAWDHVWSIWRVAFSPDGRFLACSDGSGPVELRCLEPPKPGFDLHFHSSMVHSLLFSPNGRTLISTSADRMMCVWELSTTAPRLKRHGLGVEVLAAVFSPDGRTLLAGGNDGTAVLWDMTGRWLLDDGKPPGAEERTTLWADLGTRDGEKAYRAMARLAADHEVVDLVGGVVKRADLGQIEARIKDLDSDDFRARESGSRGLEALGESAAARLRSELSKTDSVEVKVRIQALLDRLESGSASPERLRQLRAIEVLEMNGSPAALRLLEDLAKGSPQAWPTDDAIAAVKRLKMRE